jgi:hypothetical protein
MNADASISLLDADAQLWFFGMICALTRLTIAVHASGKAVL